MSRCAALLGLVALMLTPPAAAADPAWRELGPSPLNAIDAGILHAAGPMSGRVNAAVVSATDPDVVFIGASVGGVWRSTDGGAHWEPIFDDANTLGISSLVLDGETLWVGSGGNETGGDGLYRIPDAIATPADELALEGPFDARVAAMGSPAGNGRAFSGNSIVGIALDPNDPDVMYVATKAAHFTDLPLEYGPERAAPGLYVTTDATSVAPAFSRVDTLAGGTADQRLGGVTYVPGSSDELVLTLVDPHSAWGIYRTADASAVKSGSAPTFTRVQAFGASPSSGRRADVAASKDTVIVASSENVGTLYRSQDRGATFARGVAADPDSGEFATNAVRWGVGDHTGGVAIDPTDPDNIYLGGVFNTGSWRAVMASTDGGVTFRRADGPFELLGSDRLSPTLHPDTTGIVFAPSDPDVVYLTNDGGVYRTDNGRDPVADGAIAPSPVRWTSRNTPGLGITQVYTLDVHPAEPGLTLIGTQDNWAALDRPAAGIHWRGITPFGSGDVFNVGFDPSTGDPTTYVGCGHYGSIDQALASQGAGEFRWCYFNDQLAFGPGAPRTLYMGAGVSAIVRSDDHGATTRTVFGSAQSVAISPQSDAYRLFGTDVGEVHHVGEITGAWPRGGGASRVPVTALAFDPADSRTAYVGLGGFLSAVEGDAERSHVWKTENLDAARPTWVPAGDGLPDLPIRSLIVDPFNPDSLYAGTQSGVFASDDGGRTWAPFGRGLPRGCDVAPGEHCPPKLLVRNQRAMTIVQAAEPAPVLRIGTFGRGVWEASLGTRCQGRPVTIRGGVGDDKLKGTDGDDVIFDPGGDNEIKAGDGDDRICSGAGDDRIKAGKGDDRVLSIAGRDVVEGAHGDDRISTGYQDDQVKGGHGDDTVLAGGGANAVDGGDGNDRVVTLDGDDHIATGAGADHVDAGPGSNALDLGDGPDHGVAGDGDDAIDAGEGDDTCVPGRGTDDLTGCETTKLDYDWSVDEAPPGRTGDAALFSGEDSRSVDAMIVMPLSVPATDPELTFDARWNLETGYDFAAVQVSDDGGSTFSSLSCTGTTSDVEPDAAPTAQDLLPGFTGTSSGFTTQSCDLSAYAGTDVQLALRAYVDNVSGGVAAEPDGVWIDDLAIGGTVISDGTTLDGWDPVWQD